MAVLTVKFAVYGALVNGSENLSDAVNVTQNLQNAIDAAQGIVLICNSNLDADPAHGVAKNFAAVVTLDGIDRYFACGEGQTIDFFHTYPH